MKTFVKKLLVFLGCFLLFCILFSFIGEIFFRIFRGPPPPFKNIVYKEGSLLFEPNSVHYSTSPKDEDLKYTAHINKFGYRGNNFSSPKEKDVIRIMAVGDSFTYGVGAEDHETIPFLIQENLESKNFKVEVINAGIGGTSAVAHYVYLRDIHLKHDPNLVLLFFDLTDLWDDWYLERHAVFDNNGEILRFDSRVVDGKVSWLVASGHHSSFLRYFQKKVLPSIKKMGVLGFNEYCRLALQGKKARTAIVKNKEIEGSELIEYDGVLMMRGREKKDLIDKHWVRSQKYLRKIKEMLTAKGIPLIIVMYPHGIYVGEDQWSEGRRAWGFESGKLYTDHYPFELVESFAKKENIPFINSLGDFLKAKKEPFFFDWDGHLTPAGNKIIAESVTTNDIFLKNIMKLKSAKIPLP